MADPFLDALGVADPTTPKATSGPAKTYDPVDAAVRTAMTEESDPTARQWVAGVISNRAKAGKKSVGDVVQEPGQFEPWMTPAGRAKIDAIDPNSDDYKATRAQIEPILNGTSDPTGGATHFYAPDAQAKLGRNKPDFDDGNGTKIGQTLFFGGKAPAGSTGGADPFLTALGVDGSKADAVTPESVEPADMHPTVPVPKLTPAQQKTYATFAKGGYIKDDKAEGTAEAPFWETAENPASHAPAGSYFVDVKGKLQRAPGGPQDSSALAGLGQGAADVVTSLSHVMPGTDDSQIKNRLIADQMKYGAQYGGDLKSGIGRFTGQLAASAPLLAAGGAALEPALAGAGPVGEFLAGKAGGNLLTKGASLATAGAGTGASQAALTASANEGSLGKQMAEGAAGGAVLGPILPAVAAAGRGAASTVRGLVEPLTAAGRGKIANRLIGDFSTGVGSPNAAEIIPGSVPTLAQASGDPGLATLERTLRLTKPAPFAERAAQNAEARGGVLDSLRGDEQTVADLVGTRKDAVAKAEQAAFRQTGQANPHPVVGAIDAALSAPEAHMEDVARPLQGLRDKIVQPPAETTPEQTAAFHKAVTATFGADAPALTPEVMNKAKSDLGAKFEDIAGKTSLKWDDKLRSDIGDIIKNTSDVVPESQLPPLFKQLDNIASTAKEDGGITGASYQALTKRGSPLDSLMGSGDPTIRQAATRIREALDDGLERSVSSTPEGSKTLSDLRDTRLQYKNLKTVEAALKSAGPDKLVTPQAVLSAVKRNFGNFAYKGGGPLGDAAEAAVKEQAARPPITETNPKQLFGMRQSLADAIDKQTAKGTDAGDAAAKHLTTVRDALDGEISKAAPGYADYLKTAQDSAQPVAATKFLQSLKLTDMTGKMTLSRVSTALDRIADMRAKPGDNPAKAITPETLDKLKALHADLLRENNINLGRPIGPDTAQHFATNGITNKLGIPLALGLSIAHHPVAGPALALGKLFYGAKNNQIVDELTSRLLQPTPPLNVTPAARVKVNGPLRRLAAPLLPATGGQIANNLVGSK